MRYDTKVILEKRAPGQYDPETGNFQEDTVKEFVEYASVMDTRTELLKLVYGRVRQGSLTVHFQQHVPAFDTAVIDGKRYQVDYTRKLREKSSAVLSEVQA